MQRLIAIYMRVSSRQQDTRSQEPDLRRWAEAYADAPVKWYTDKFTGKTMDRPGWRRLEGAMASRPRQCQSLPAACACPLATHSHTRGAGSQGSCYRRGLRTQDTVVGGWPSAFMFFRLRVGHGR